VGSNPLENHFNGRLESFAINLSFEHEENTSSGSLVVRTLISGKIGVGFKSPVRSNTFTKNISFTLFWNERLFVQIPWRIISMEG
jgi:hypothetical protein